MSPMAERRGHGREHPHTGQLQQERDLLAPRLLRTQLPHVSLDFCYQGIQRIFQREVLPDAQLLCRRKREREPPGASLQGKGFPLWSAQIVALQHSLQAITSGNPLLDESLPMGHQGTYARAQRLGGPRLPE